jgi:hypothetical protein
VEVSVLTSAGTTRRGDPKSTAVMTLCFWEIKAGFHGARRGFAAQGLSTASDVDQKLAETAFVFERGGWALNTKG